MNGNKHRRFVTYALLGVLILVIFQAITYFQAKKDNPSSGKVGAVELPKEPQRSPIREFIWKGHHLDILKAACGPMTEDKTETIPLDNGPVTFRTRSCPGLTFDTVGNSLASIEISSHGFSLAGDIRIGRSTAADIRALLGPEDPHEKAEREFGAEAVGKTAKSINYSDWETIGYDHVRFDLDEQGVVRKVVWSYYRDD